VDTRASLDDLEKRTFLTIPGLKLRPLGRPARSQSLYRLSYPGSCLNMSRNKKSLYKTRNISGKLVLGDDVPRCPLFEVRSLTNVSSSPPPVSEGHISSLLKSVLVLRIGLVLDHENGVIYSSKMLGCLRNTRD
jgi:hypothetical protein